jgi:hypothetical protein
MARRWQTFAPSSTPASSSSVTSSKMRGPQRHDPSESSCRARNRAVLWGGNIDSSRRRRRSTRTAIAGSTSATCSSKTSVILHTKSLLLEDDPSLRSVTSELHSSVALNDSLSPLRGSDEIGLVSHCPELRRRESMNREAEESVLEHRKLTDFDASSSSFLNAKRSVTFSTVEIHVHSRALGDNPSVSSGPPITLGQTVLGSDMRTVDEYESFRVKEAPRRSKRDLLLGRMDREDLLKEYGYSRSDFVEAENEVRKFQLQRRASSRKSLLEKVKIRLRSLIQSKSSRSLPPPAVAASKPPSFD